MATASTPTTTVTSVRHFWRKVQGKLIDYAANFGDRYEYKFAKSCGSPDFPWSGYEATWSADLNDRYGIATVPDSGLLAIPSSVDTVEMNQTAIHLDGRFTFSNWAKMGARGDTNQIVNQLTAQSTQKMQAMIEEWGDKFWGQSSAILCRTNTDFAGVSTATITLISGYDQSWITNPFYLATLWRVGDKGALLAPGNTLITNGFFTVTARDVVNGTITVTFAGSVTTSTDGLGLVKANNLEQTTVTAGTDFNNGITGMTEAFLSTSLHGQSGATYQYWNASYGNTTAGRFTLTKLLNMRQSVQDGCKLKMNALHVSHGVYRDINKELQAAVRFDSPMGLLFDGSVKTTEGLHDQKRVPPGSVWGMATKALSIWDIYKMDGDKTENDLLPYTDYAADVGRVDWFGNLIWSSRQALAYSYNQTESN